MILDEIRLTTQDAIFYLESLKSELNMLSMHHLSTNTISPEDLKELLIESESMNQNFQTTLNCPEILVKTFGTSTKLLHSYRRQ